MRSRRAVASVVGMVFAIIALTTTITYISYSMGILNNYNQSVLVKNQQLTDVDKEKFQISSVTVPNGKLNITVADTGSLPIQFTKVWIQNTSATDQVYSYVPTHNFVSPGGILTNIGQSMTLINAADSYNVKVVTSRGNTQQFTINSPNTSPLNLQLLAMPPTIPTGFKTQLMMIVTNNSTGTLINVSPQTPTLVSHNATSCNLGVVSPTKINTLPQGETTVFSWPVTVIGNGNTYCTFQAQLQNGFPGQSVQATVIVSTVPVSSKSINSALSTIAGVLTINYTTFGWAQQSVCTCWNNGFSFSGLNPTIFEVNVTNNNSTGDFYVSKYSTLGFHLVTSGSGGKNDVPFFIVDSAGIPSSFTTKEYGCSGSLNDYCIRIPANRTFTLYFAGSGAESGDNDINKLCTGSCTGLQYSSMLLLYGKFATSQSQAATTYGQDIPFLAVVTK